jgi:hypothetical protein
MIERAKTGNEENNSKNYLREATVDTLKYPECIIVSPIMFVSSRRPERIFGSSHLEPV